jgi:hypothetical protein
VQLCRFFLKKVSYGSLAADGLLATGGRGVSSLLLLLLLLGGDAGA